MALLSLAPVASAQPGNPLSPGLPQPSVSSTTSATRPSVPVAPVTTSSTGGGISGTDAVAIGIGAIVVLAAISFFIWRDARRRAPVRQRSPDEVGGRRAGSKAPPKPRKLSPAERRRRKRGRARR